MATLDIKYLCNPTDGTPGPPFDAFEVDAMNAASKGDKRGYSVADTWLGIDEGGTDPTAPALPPGATAMAVEAQNCRRSRQKNAYQFLVTHCLDKDHTAHMKREFFGDGFAAWNYLCGELRTPVDALMLRERDAEWRALNILSDVGVNENSLTLMAKKLRTCNSRRPAANRYNENQQTERLLELIFECSQHFSTKALCEYNALPAYLERTVRTCLFFVARPKAERQSDDGKVEL